MSFASSLVHREGARDPPSEGALGVLAPPLLFRLKFLPEPDKDCIEVFVYFVKGGPH